MNSMPQETILIVDDDPAIRKLLIRVAASNQFDAVAVSGISEAVAHASSGSFDLILLDLMMQGYDDGFDIIKHLRSHGNQTPIIIISGRSEDFDTLYGLEIGADDYITKPFNPVVLGAKMKALVRRDKQAANKAQGRIAAGPFFYNPTTLELTKNGTAISLSSKEQVLMNIFLTHIGQVLSKEQLFELVWNNSVSDESIIMVYVSHLRNKIEDDPKNPKYLKTVWGIGYKFQV